MGIGRPASGPAPPPLWTRRKQPSIFTRIVASRNGRTTLAPLGPEQLAQVVEGSRLGSANDRCVRRAQKHVMAGDHDTSRPHLGGFGAADDTTGAIRGHGPTVKCLRKLANFAAWVAGCAATRSLLIRAAWGTTHAGQ